MSLYFSDPDEGVTLETAHGITVIGGGAVTLEAPVIEMSSPSQVGLYYTAGQSISGGRAPPTGMTVYQSGSMCVAETGQSIETGQDSWELAAFTDDIPEEGQFDWGGLFGNILAGLAVVGAVVLVAATFGAAAPVLIAGAVAGAVAVGGKAASDIARGNVSSVEDYMREAFISTTVGLVTGAIGNGISGLKAVQTLGKVGKAMVNIGVDMLQGAAGSAINQLMRADLYGQDIDWGHFWQDIGISTVSSMVSGGVGRGISGKLTDLAGGVLRNSKPGMNAAITAGIAGASGSGTNFAMQLGNMALFDENGNLNFDLNRVSWGNMDWNSVLNSGIIGVAQQVATSYAQQRQNGNPALLDDTPDKLLLTEPEDVAGGIAERGKVGPQDQPDAVEGNGQPRVGGSDETNVFDEAGDNLNKLSKSDDNIIFAYKNNPMDDPNVAKDIIKNTDAVYGYSPNPESERIGTYADYDWTDPEQVAFARARREVYHTKNASIENLVDIMRTNGDSSEGIARAANELRNQNRLNDYANDPVGLERVKQSNLRVYDNENGPTAEALYIRYGSWESVINSSINSNLGMDACCGLYDKYFTGGRRN